MSTDIERAAFERTEQSSDLGLVFDFGVSGEYRNPAVQNRWVGWNRRATPLAPTPAAAEGRAEVVAWQRKWDADGETPKKEKNANGRMAWPFKFKLLPITKLRILPDDVPLYAGTPQTAPAQAKSAPARNEKD